MLLFDFQLSQREESRKKFWYPFNILFCKRRLKSVDEGQVSFTGEFSRSRRNPGAVSVGEKECDLKKYESRFFLNLLSR